MLNTTESSPDDSNMWKKVIHEKGNFLIHTISLAAICLLLLAVAFVVCYYY